MEYVYLAKAGEYDDEHVVAVYTTEKAAEQCPLSEHVTKMPLRTEPGQTEDVYMTYWRHPGNKDFTVTHWGTRLVGDAEPGTKVQTHRELGWGKTLFIVHGTDREEVANTMLEIQDNLKNWMD